MKNLWQKWKKISNKLLDKEATIILTLLYFILIAPFALILRIFTDPLNMKSNKNSFWLNKDLSNVSSKDALKKQY